MKARIAPTATERVTTWIGSRASLVTHTIIFVLSFSTALVGLVKFDTMLLVLTTALSLEAIYLAIFIQMTVNANTASLREVEEDIDEIQEDVEELGEDLDEIQEDIGEIQEDVEEMSEDIEELSEEETPESVPELPSTDSELLQQLTRDVARMLDELESLKKKIK